MDQSSPISLDLGFGFSVGTESDGDHTIDGPIGREGAHGVTRLQDGQFDGFGKLSQEQRPSIDSVFDQEIEGEWSPTGDVSSSAGLPGPIDPENADGSGSKKSTRDNKPPTWSELKTKAGKERKRLPLACIACRRKKIKCSGEKPACKHCMRARIPCVYKVTARKAAPRTDYMAMLDKRLKRMEDRVIKMIPNEDMPDLSATGRSSVRPPLPGQPETKEKSTLNKRTAEEAFDAELNDWQRPRKSAAAGATQNRSQGDFENKLTSQGAESLPPPLIQEHLAELFFDCVYGQSYLLLHKPSFMRKLKAGNVPPVLVLAVCAISARFSTHPQVSTEPAFLRGKQWATPARNIIEKRHFEPNITILTAMLILGLHYFGTCEGGLSWSFGGQAMRLGYALQLHRELDHDPLGHAQAERVGASGESTPKIPELSFTDREIRRRLMWACYLMDIFNSSGTERPSFLNEEYIKIQLPIKESHFQLELPGLTEDLDGHVAIPKTAKSQLELIRKEARSNLGVAAYVIRAVVIWKRIVQYLNLGGKEKDPHPIWDELSQFASLQRQIAQLKSSLPEGLKYTPENLATHVSERLANQYLFLHIVIAQLSLFLHRFAIPTAPNLRRPYPPNTPKQFLARCATTVVQAASLVSKIVSDSTGHTLTVPFAGYCAYASATVHVWGIFSKHPSLEASSKENLRHNYRYLTRMKRYWGMFHYMAESVKDVYRAFADAAARQSGDQNKNKSIIKNVKGDKNDLESFSISASPSRAPSPASMPTNVGEGEAVSSPKVAGTHSAGDDAGKDNTTRTGKQKDDSSKPSKSASSSTDNQQGEQPTSPSNTETPTSGKLMLQYGDWFDRYPHGVSATEWESSHLLNTGDATKGAEAVMSQQSDLKSVEEFFASLSPPSKAVERDTEMSGSGGGAAGQRGKKVARRKGKSVAENLLTQAQTQAQAQSLMEKNNNNNDDKAKDVKRDGSGDDTVWASRGQGPGQRQSRQGQIQRLQRSQLGPLPAAQSQVPLQQSKQSIPHERRHGSLGQTRLGTGNPTGQSSGMDMNIDIFDIDIPTTSDLVSVHQQPLRSQHGTGFDMSTDSPTYFNTPSFPQTRFTSNPKAGSAHPRSYLDFDYNSPSTVSNPGSTTNPSGGDQMNFNFNYTSALPHLDRQMVFGAYAGLDPSRTNNSSALNNPNNLDFWTNPWENQGSIDLDGLGGFENVDMRLGPGTPASNNDATSAMMMPDGSGPTSAGHVKGDNFFNVQQQTGRDDRGMGSSAWFMPFNIEPPVFTGLEDFGPMDDADMSGVGADSFSGPPNQNNGET